MSKGLFIVFEGVDGAGSSTQAQLLQNYFTQINQKSIISPEPSDGPIGKLLREFLGGRNDFNNQDLYDQQMAYLFAADRHYHLYNNFNGVYSLRSKNIHVISTRYYFSSLAYNGKNEKDYDFICLLNQKFPPPDLVIYLDIPVDLALERMCDRPLKEIYETKEKLIKVRERFQEIFANYPHKMLKIDARENPQKIHGEIINYLEKWNLSN
ncbi:dTMP kinase [Cyanobacterium stanieri LEGE 03274]|uniref:Thymidylate kinase n=1 Tax=Cyanobacterium stanieri LEGE 03274 TaxID=1828756 RepID=A0ABR9V520_9CHRO|nr:dTMP kinase [Cyanobacterium stanieri]MBE9222986.1 dTMP kinase [Cyanobacterium stanieri LEGE 03274]